MTKPCSKCHQLNPAEAAFCLNCASPIGPIAPSPQFGGPTGAPTPSQKGLISLILAIVALVCCGPFAGIPAAILGWMELDSIKNGRSPADNKWMAMVGLWGGIASTVLHIIGYVLYVMLGMLSAMSSPYDY
ncbi:MAG: zinc ribbon domain-containing protein [bacterium]|nr:zinc ribbon domain-containing protein [bacterium]